MAWTDPPDWSDGVALTASELDTYVTADLNYLKAAVDGITFSGCSVRLGSAQTISDSTDTYLSFSTETYDYGSWFPGSGTTITVPSGAVPSGFTTIALLVVAWVKFEQNTNGIRLVEVHQNGSSVQGQSVRASSGGTTDIGLTTIVVASAADTMQLNVRQTSGGSLDATSAHLIIARFLPVA